MSDWAAWLIEYSYTDEGNFDLVGNNIPVFFIQDAIQFPDLIHSVKPNPDNEIPQAATAHDTAWDFFSQQSTTMHTLFWAMAGYGIPRSYRHMVCLACKFKYDAYFLRQAP
jgi:catalase